MEVIITDTTHEADDNAVIVICVFKRKRIM